uniref:Uncharacterized protein n=1 Tax=Chromera velia CCMP2878 TaxID=1169474 RepID=A0A0G4IBT6_9ALVE|eukprot:Cvel_12891.t1-p1 / transcript=Cvel_12891.t1 / gene=Cvel_12891 / organism=Chromera_velia_CCMP2878 / gene_product=hypothetical protein / transcript_product=hypothetical protein / location=Cvel_scaffold861:29216-32611(-) / protein_length=461 / sequence_SO=supercontig / SO=protein_coding / is_pseudo=false
MGNQVPCCGSGSARKDPKLPQKTEIFLRVVPRYTFQPESLIIACFFNPTKSKLRLEAFDVWYRSVEHLNIEIVECVREGEKPELALKYSRVKVIETKVVLWHKEAILNYMIRKVLPIYKYRCSCLLPAGATVLQPFSWCYHLDRDETGPSTELSLAKEVFKTKKERHPNLWRSFAATWNDGDKTDALSHDYGLHGHVGFLWGARLEILRATLLYDKCLIGGADHVIAHAAVGQLQHPCILKAFSADLEPLQKWCLQFSQLCQGRLGFVESDLFHIFHGKLERRQYLKRIRDFTPLTKHMKEKDTNGLYTTTNPKILQYINQYFRYRDWDDNDGHSEKSESQRSNPCLPSTPNDSGGGDSKRSQEQQEECGGEGGGERERGDEPGTGGVGGWPRNASVSSGDSPMDAGNEEGVFLYGEERREDPAGDGGEWPGEPGAGVGAVGGEDWDSGGGGNDDWGGNYS